MLGKFTTSLGILLLASSFAVAGESAAPAKTPANARARIAQTQTSTDQGKKTTKKRKLPSMA